MKKIITSAILLCSLGFFAVTPIFTFAVGQQKATGDEVIQNVQYTPLAPIPGLTDGSSTNPTDLATFLAQVFNWVIMLCGLLAVIFIFYGGFKYAAEESIFGKADARKTIENALYGLGLALASWFLLNLINPQLLSLKVSDIPNERVQFNGGSMFGIESVTTQLRAERTTYEAVKEQAINLRASGDPADIAAADKMLMEAEATYRVKSGEINVDASNTALAKAGTTADLKVAIDATKSYINTENGSYDNASEAVKQELKPQHEINIETLTQNAKIMEMQSEVNQSGSVPRAKVINVWKETALRSETLAQSLEAQGKKAEAATVRAKAVDTIRRIQSLPAIPAGPYN